MRLPILILMFFFVIGLHSQIFSTASGGLWSDPSTWIDGTIPGPGNDVVIIGPVQLDYTTEVSSLSLTSLGILENHTSYHRTLTITGGLDNQGIIRDNTAYNLTIDLQGDFYTSGTITNEEFNFNPSANVSVSMSADATIASENVYVVSEAPGNLIAASDLQFQNGDPVDFNDHILDLTSGYDVSWTNCQVHDIEIHGGTGSMVTSDSDSSTRYSTFNDVTLNGTNYLYNTATMHNCVINGSVINHPGYYLTITSTGFLTNNGTIQNHPTSYNIRLYTSGNVINNGTWDIYEWTLQGTQQLTTSPGTTFDVYTLYNNANNGADVTANSDLSFVCNTLDFNSFDLDLSGGPWDLTFASHLREIDLIGAPGSRCTGAPGSRSTNVTGIDITTDGEHTFYGTCVFTNLVNDGILQNYSAIGHTLIIDGSLTNNGTIRNNPSGQSMSLDCYGDIVNNGTFDINILNFKGTGDRTITVPAREPILSSYVYCLVDSGAVIAASDLSFQGNTLDFNDRTFDLSGGYTIDIDAIVREIAVTGGNGATMIFHDGNYIHSFTGNDLIFDGIINIYTAEVTRLTNQGIIQNRTTNSYTLELHDTLTNYGTIRTNPAGYSLSVRTDGDIQNNGGWNGNYLYLSGTSEQLVSSPDSAVVLSYLIDEDGSSPIRFISDIQIEGTTFDLNNAELILEDNVTRTATSLYLTDCLFRDGIVTGADGSQFHADGLVRLDDLEIHDVTTYGLFSVQNNVTWYNLTNEGTIQNHNPSHYISLLYGTTTNHGTIQANPAGYGFTIDVYGDLIHSGNIDLTRIRFYGSGLLTIDATGGYPFDVDTFHINGPDSVRFESSIHITGASSDFFNTPASIADNSDFTIDGGFLRETSITAGDNCTFTMSNDAYLTLVELDGFICHGAIQVRSDVILNNVTINDTLRNDNVSTYSVTLGGDFVNNGIIHHPSYGLNVEILGNFHNAGTFITNQIDIDGTTDQLLFFERSHEIWNSTRIYSDTGSGAWYLDGNDLAYAGGYIDLSGINTDTYGIYNCAGTSGMSRNIRIQSYPDQPDSLTITPTDSDVTITWTQCLLTDHYVLYGADSPDGPFTIIEPVITDDTPDDGIVSWTIVNPTDRIKFYRVVAVN